MIQEGRYTKLTPGRKPGNGPVVYWMSRDQRVADNWAYLYAQHWAAEMGREYRVVFTLTSGFIGATLRHYEFMLHGLQEVEEHLRGLNVPFILLEGEPPAILGQYCELHDPAMIITDFDPLRIKRAWKDRLIELTTVPLIEVDAHNIVPCRLAYPKAAFGAYTIRPSINRMLKEYLLPFPDLKPFPGNSPVFQNITDWEKVLSGINVDRTVTLPEGITPGMKAGHALLRKFISSGLDAYPADRNDPLAEATSGLSPYLHFGQLSAQRVALEVSRSDSSEEAKSAFLEELIVRRELADNFCFYQHDYDSFGAFHPWAAASLNAHLDDEREYLYSQEDFEFARTHDPLWNAAQIRLLVRGSMHGYMRMYWAKKILEWSRSPEEAMKIAIYLNDRYQLDGRDPNGYTGIAWSIGGVHDRAWQERPVYGKIRYMNQNGCRRKFDVDAYVSLTPHIKSLSKM